VTGDFVALTQGIVDVTAGELVIIGSEQRHEDQLFHDRRKPPPLGPIVDALHSKAVLAGRVAAS
jgi:hypothetical protein